MSVPEGKRKLSKVEFNNTYHKIYSDAIKLMLCNFGASKEKSVEYEEYIKYIKPIILNKVSDIGKHIRIANSIYPKSKYEYEARRYNQGCAIGLCYDLLTLYQLIMNIVKVADNKYINEIKNIEHEINCLKKWRTSEVDRFINLG